jgi:hypothetical protein
MRKNLLLIIYIENKPSTDYTTKTRGGGNAVEYYQNLLTHFIRNEMCLCRTKVPENRLGKSYFT